MFRLLYLTLLLSAGMAFADPSCNFESTFGSAVDSYHYQGCLQGETGFNVNPDSGPWTDIIFSWNITAISGGFHYEYQFDDAAPTKGLSHLILGVSEDCGAGCVSNYKFSTGTGPVGPDYFTPQDGKSNPGLPSTLYGIKMDGGGAVGSFTFSFDSTHVPVWQNLYLKDGVTGTVQDKAAVWAYNWGFEAAEGVRSFYVAAPDTKTSLDVAAVPEPSAYIVLILGLSGVCLAVRRQRNAS